MIKQIQLRGISRTPSDRMTADGGCAESLNVYVDGNEVVPMTDPKDITDDYISTGEIPGTVIYVHKSRSYNNLIYYSAGSNIVNALKKGSESITESLYIFTLKSGETIKDVTSVGNTLIFATSDRMEYALYKDGTYHDLGDKIPQPQVEFRCTKVPDNKIYSYNTPTVKQNQIYLGFDKMYGSKVYQTQHKDYAQYDPLKAWDQLAWSVIIRGIDNGQVESLGDSTLAAYGEIKNMIWDAVTAQIRRYKQYGHFATPVLARFALRLYDDSYIYQSAPVLLGAGVKEFISAVAKVEDYRNDSDVLSLNTLRNGIQITFNNIYDAIAIINDYSFEGWEDVVKGIDIFLSLDIHYPVLHGDILGLATSFTQDSDTPDVSHNNWHTVRSHGDIYLAPTDAEKSDAQALDEILAKRNFYRVASFDVNNLEELREGCNLMKGPLISQDKLNQQLKLPDGYLSHDKVASSLLTYNNRLMLSEITYNLTPGYAFLNGPMLSSGTDKYEYEFKYYIRGLSNETATVMARNIDNEFLFSPYGKGTYFSGAYAWLSYPDTRCYKVDIKVVKNGNDFAQKTFAMHPFPGLNVAYAYFGMEERVGLSDGEDISQWNHTERPTLAEDNVLWASKINNPFSFLASGKLSFSAKVINEAVVTKPLSEGQFGRFPLYVFTEDGIWAVEIGSDGSFSSIHAVSRDAAISKEVVPIDQAVVFLSDKGVMLLTGSQSQCISDKMNGKHYMLDSGVADMLVLDSDWSGLLPATADSDTFMSFMKEAKIAYDYIGSRLICARPDKDYAYVYRFPTDTWHKLSFPSGYTFIDTINSYPSTWLSMGKGEEDKLVIVGVSAHAMEEAVSAYATAMDYSEERAEAVLTGRKGIDITYVPSSVIEEYKGYIEELGSVGSYSTKTYMTIDVNVSNKAAFIRQIKTITGLNIKDIKMAVDGERPLEITGLAYDVVLALKEAIEDADGSQEVSYHLFVNDFAPSGIATIKGILTDAGYSSDVAEAVVSGQAELDISELDASTLASLKSSLEEVGYSWVIDKSHAIVNYSTVIDVLSETNSKGIIVTRPFDLGEPDVRKAIKSIRVRGAFDRNDVKYLLLGSFDGIEWKLLPSLRGGSYKMFRLVLLAKLTQTERISWIDVDYEPRYATKLR